MTRIFALIVAVAVVALVGFGIFVFATGGQRPPLLIAERDAQPAQVGQPTADITPATTTPEAAARFDAWAKQLRDRELTVTAQSITARGDTMDVSGFTVVGPQRGSNWRWSIQNVVVYDLEPFHLQASGETTVTLTTPVDGEITWSGKADGLGIAIQQDGRGQGGRSLVVRLNGLALAGAPDAPPLTLNDGYMRLVLQGGTGLLPPGTKLALQLTDVAIPDATNAVVGSRLKSFTTEFTLHRALKGFAFEDMLGFLQPGVEGGVGLGTLAADWGPLHLRGDGIFNISAGGRLGGRLQVELAEPLSLLDALAAKGEAGAQWLTDAYGTLLLEIGRNPEAGVPFTLAMDGGNVVLQGATRGLADIPLGTVPRMPTGTGENTSESVSAERPQGSIRSE